MEKNRKTCDEVYFISPTSPSIDVFPCSSHSSHNSSFTSSIFHFIFADSSPPSKHTHVPEYKHSQKLKAEQSSFEGVKPLVDVHPPLGTWDESAAES